MKGLDTNILVRYLTKDNIEQRRMLVENESVYRAVLQQYKEGQGDFSDYLIGQIIGQINLHAGCLETATFDRKLSDTEHF